MFCTKCGKSLPENSKFCTGCGQPVSPAGAFSGGAVPPPGAVSPPGTVPPPGPGVNPGYGAPVPAMHKTAPQRNTQTFIALGILAVLFAVIAVAAYLKWNAGRTLDKPDPADNHPDAIASAAPSAAAKSYYDMGFDEIYAEFLGTYTSGGYTLQIGYSSASQAPVATLDSGAGHYYLDSVSTNVERPDWVSLDLATASREVTVRFAPNYDDPDRYQAFLTTAYGGTTKLTDIVKTSDAAPSIAPYLPDSVFPNSSSQPLNSWEVETLSDADLTYAINEIYARHGYIFKSDELRRHFEQFSWYHGTIPADEFSFEMLNSVEQQNLNLLANERNRRK